MTRDPDVPLSSETERAGRAGDLTAAFIIMGPFGLDISPLPTISVDSTFLLCTASPLSKIGDCYAEVFFFFARSNRRKTSHFCAPLILESPICRAFSPQCRTHHLPSIHTSTPSARVQIRIGREPVPETSQGWVCCEPYINRLVGIC